MATSRRRRRPVATPVLVLIVVLAFSAAFAVGWLSARSRTTRSTTPPPTSPAPPISAPVTGATYSVSGNRIVFEGQSFTPEGITVFGLAYPDWQTRISSDLQQIDATAQSWHGNTVRIQVAPTDLLDQQPYDAAYLSAIDQEIQSAHRDGLIVILSAQYERSTPTPFPEIRRRRNFGSSSRRATPTTAESGSICSTNRNSPPTRLAGHPSSGPSGRMVDLAMSACSNWLMRFGNQRRTSSSPRGSTRPNRLQDFPVTSSRGAGSPMQCTPTSEPNGVHRPPGIRTGGTSPRACRSWSTSGASTSPPNRAALPMRPRSFRSSSRT